MAKPVLQSTDLKYLCLHDLARLAIRLFLQFIDAQYTQALLVHFQYRQAFSADYNIAGILV